MVVGAVWVRRTVKMRKSRVLQALVIVCVFLWPLLRRFCHSRQQAAATASAVAAVATAAAAAAA